MAIPDFAVSLRGQLAGRGNPELIGTCMLANGLTLTFTGLLRHFVPRNDTVKEMDHFIFRNGIIDNIVIARVSEAIPIHLESVSVLVILFNLC